MNDPAFSKHSLEFEWWLPYFTAAIFRQIKITNYALKRHNQAKIIKKSVLVFRLLIMTI